MILFKLALIAVTLSLTGVKSMRVEYFDTAENQKHLPDLQKTVSTYKKTDQYYYCYLAAYYSLESKFASGISKKLQSFNLSKTNLEKSFSIKETLDAHFIRFCIQTNAPSILSYKNDINTDKKYILANIKNEPDLQFKQKIKEFMLVCKEVSKTEKETLKNI